MGVIVPALLVRTRKELEEKLARVEDIVDTVQIDAVDGNFASPASWPYGEGENDLDVLVRENKNLPFADQCRIEADLMVESATVEAVAERWVAAGASRLVFHIAHEERARAQEILTRVSLRLGYENGLTQNMLSLGLALMPDDDLTAAEPFLDKIDYVQYMGIAHIGRQGEPFVREVVNRVRSFHARYPTVPVQVDGGVSLETAPALLQAGAAYLVIGSGIWESADVAARLHALEDLALRYGTYER